MESVFANGSGDGSPANCTLRPIPDNSAWRQMAEVPNRLAIGEAMTSSQSLARLKACHGCGLIHALRDLRRHEFAYCCRCRAVIARFDGGRSTAQRTAATALAALILFWPAILLPILEIERLGHRHQSSIWGGTIDLLQHGDWFVGTVVLLFSIVVPLLKIGLLLELSVAGLLHQRHRALTYRVMEHAGKWSMMDVMLLAFLVMLVKLENLVQFHFGPAVVAFVLCVGLSMLASISFDPHAIWEEKHE